MESVSGRLASNRFAAQCNSGMPLEHAALSDLACEVQRLLE
jgi:hypothetical protein